MNKREYAEFQKYLGLLYYEYHKMLLDKNLSEESVNQIKEMLDAINLVRQICIMEGK